MKLRTRLVPLGSRMSVDGEAADAWHDAMAAQALLQALRNEAPGVHARVIERADEILAGWLGEE